MANNETTIAVTRLLKVTNKLAKKNEKNNFNCYNNNFGFGRVRNWAVDSF
jgi:hypothetical protein